jgi:hypothetical protein
MSQIQKDADALDLALFNASENIRAFIDRHGSKLRAQQRHTMLQLAMHMESERHLFRSLMDPAKRVETQGWKQPPPEQPCPGCYGRCDSCPTQEVL